MPLNAPWSLKGKAVKMGLTNPPTTDFGCQTITAALSQNHQIAPVPATACQNGQSTYQQSNPEWNLTFLEDWNTADPASVCRFLANNHGKNGFIAVQDPGTSAGVLSAVTFLAPDFNSTAENANNQTSVRLPVQGAIQYIAPV